MSLTRRSLLVGMTTWLGSTLWTERAPASTFTPLTLEELVGSSLVVAVGRPVERWSSWVKAGGKRRIVTTTRLLHDETWLDGDGAGESLVSTLGGRVGEVAQKVHGEASLRSGEPCLVFLGDERETGRAVVGLSQGHYPLSGAGALRRLARSPDLPSFATTPTARWAVARLESQALDEARRAVKKLLGERARR